MATVRPTVTYPNDDSVRVTWAAFNSGDTIVAYDGASEYADRSVEVSGTFNSGTVVLQGSNSGSGYYTLRDTASTALSFTTADLREVLEYVYSLKPSVSGDGGSGSITVVVLAKRTKK